MKARTSAGSSVEGASALRGPKRKVGRGPIAEGDAGLLVAVRHRRIGHAHERVRSARRHAGHELRQIEQGGRRRAKPRHFAGKKCAIVAFALALAEKRAPILARDRADTLGHGNEAVLPTIDLAIGLQSFVARAHAMQRDQDHRQVIGEAERELRAPLSRPGDGPRESLVRRGVPMRSDGARPRRSHELLL